LPQPGRRFDRFASRPATSNEEQTESPDRGQDSPLEVATPLPELFGQQR
jgi:hypothetical protein